MSNDRSDLRAAFAGRSRPRARPAVGLDALLAATALGDLGDLVDREARATASRCTADFDDPPVGDASKPGEAATIECTGPW